MTLAQTTTTPNPSVSENHYEILVNGKPELFDRVTSVLHKTKARDGLNKWYSLEERKAMLVLLDGCQTVQEAREKIVALQAHAAEQVRDDKADLGKAIHAMIERDLVGTNIPQSVMITAEAVTRFNHFLDWKKAHRVEGVPNYKMAEHTVHSVPLLVAGTLDLHVLVDGVEKILDNKTGRAIYRDHAVQVALYALLEQEGRARDAGDEETLIRFDQAYNDFDCPEIKWPGMSILHLPEEGCFEYEINPAEAEAYVRCFLSRLRAFRCDEIAKPFRRIWPKEEKRWLRLK